MATTATWISRKPDRCGGNACVRDTRITVWGIVRSRQLGMSDDVILSATPGLTPADLEAAFEFAAANPDEIERAISQNEEGDEGFVE